MICPKCKGKAIVTHTDSFDERMETIRYHLCKACKNKFSTVERPVSGWKYEDWYIELIKAIKKVVREYE